MTKKWFQRAVTAAMVFLLAAGQCVTGFADDWDNGTPGLVIGGDGVYEVEAGETTRLTIQLKNTGAGTAENVNVQAKGAAGIIPYKLSLAGGGNVGDIGVNGYRELKLTVTMDDIVEESNYPVTLNFSYNGSGGGNYSGSGTIYLKVKGYGREPDFLLDNMTLVPESLSPGETAELSGRVVNRGTQDMHQVELSLDNLSAEGISLVSGFSSKTVAQIPVGGETAFRFPLAASADMAAGNYPVTIKLKYQDEFGKAYEKTQQFYVNVGGVAGKKADLEIRNMKEPGGTYGVNQNFTVSFDLYNAGETTAKSIAVTAEAVDATAVVPKSASRKTVKELAPGASVPFSFQFAGTSSSTSQNYAIQFTVEYTSGGSATTTFKQYAGVNVSNPDKDDENESKPKIIVSNYVSDPLIVMAGDEFDLTMTLMNTHKEKAVKNIKMFLTLAEETSSETEKSGNIFTPVNSSNTFYFDSIGPKSTVDKSLRLYVVPDAQPKTYTLTVNFEYEDGNGKEYTAQELLGINVKQVTQLQIDEFSIPEMVEVYQPVSVSFSYYNTGKVTLNNVMIKVEGDVDCQNKSTYIGNMESGNSEYFETTFSAMQPGETPVTIIVSYEDPSGETVEERRELMLNAMEPMMPEDMEGEPENPPLDMGQIAKYIGILAVLGAGLVFFMKKQKEEPKRNAESMNSDDFEDDDEDDDFDYEALEEDENDKEGMPL